MRMIPGQPSGATNSQAELRVFDQLRSAFSGPDQNGWFAMHSLNFPKHEYKRFGEIDFVVAGPQGLFVLEVKGGGVSSRDGIWETRDRYGTTKQLRESPFKQAEGALHGLRGRLPAAIANAFVIGYGVVTPDVERFPDSAEWDRATLADARDFRRFEQWLERLIAHWRAKDKRKPPASAEQLKELQRHLRPDFESVVSLHSAAHGVEASVVRITEDQMRLIDIVEANSRVICSGGAGTGKTMLALELAKRWGASGMKVALACCSPWLKNFLERKSLPGLTVTLADSIHIAARRVGVTKFDALIVDEGQDLLNMDALDRLDSYLGGGLGAGRWCFFHDANNQSGLCGAYVADAYDYLDSFAPARIPLKTNCRNSLPILNRIQGALQADIGNSGVGDGPAVREINVDDDAQAVLVLARELHQLIDVEGFSPGEIAILSPMPFAQSWVSSLPVNLRQSIAILDDSSPRNISRRGIGFAGISDFKGLESEVVVLIDMPEAGRHADLRSLQYVGMSRARSLLSMICRR